MVIKSPAASAMRAKESTESPSSTSTVKNSRIVRLGGFGNSAKNGSTTLRNTRGLETKELERPPRSAGVRMVYKPAVRHSEGIARSVAASVKPVSAPARPLALSSNSVSSPIRSGVPSGKPVKSTAKTTFKPTSSSAKPAVSIPLERAYREEKAEKSFFQKRAEAFPTTRIGAKLSAIQAEFIPQVSFWKVLVLSVAAGLFGITYIHHGFQMQEQLNRVEALELQMERTQRVFTEKQIRYDRLTGPKEIYQKAQEAGFVSSGPANQSIPVRIDTP